MALGWKRLPAVFVSLMAVGTSVCFAQDQVQSQPAPGTPPPAATPASPATPAQPAAAAPASDANVSIAPEKKIYTVPAGTKVLLELRSAINTKSAKPGDGVYLSSTFPVVVGNRVMIPNGVYVQGVVDRVQRGGRIKGKAQLDMHFTSIIFPNGSVVEIPGMVNSLPGAKNQTVKDDGEGTISKTATRAATRAAYGRDCSSVRRRRRHHWRGRIGTSHRGRPDRSCGWSRYRWHCLAFHAQRRRRYSPWHPGRNGSAAPA